MGSWNLDASAQNVDFPDANLAAVVRRTLSLADGADIPQTSLEAITSLFGNRQGITDLTGLEKATGLQYLQLRGNPIRDFTPISSLTNLLNLNLINTGFSNSDISILSPLVNLQYGLFLDQNEISDLQALVNVISTHMPNLNTLYIAENRFRDITPLTTLKDQLRMLGIKGNQIVNLGRLAELTNLIELDLERTGISNLEPLRNLVKLTVLNISENPISDLEPLRNLVELERLYMDGTQVSDLEPLSGLAKLYTLWARWNPFEPGTNPFEPLRGLTAMTRLRVDDTFEAEVRVMFPNISFRDTDFVPPRPEPTPESEPEPEPEPEPKVKPRRIITQCGLGWAPQSQFQHAPVIPKVMIYALEFEYNPAPNAGYTCTVIEIRTGNCIFYHSCRDRKIRPTVEIKSGCYGIIVKPIIKFTLCNAARLGNLASNVGFVFSRACKYFRALL